MIWFRLVGETVLALKTCRVDGPSARGCSPRRLLLYLVLTGSIGVDRRSLMFGGGVEIGSPAQAADVASRRFQRGVLLVRDRDRRGRFTRVGAHADRRRHIIAWQSRESKSRLIWMDSPSLGRQRCMQEAGGKRQTLGPLKGMMRSAQHLAKFRGRKTPFLERIVRSANGRCQRVARLQPDMTAFIGRPRLTGRRPDGGSGKTIEQNLFQCSPTRQWRR